MVGLIIVPWYVRGKEAQPSHPTAKHLAQKWSREKSIWNTVRVFVQLALIHRATCRNEVRRIAQLTRKCHNPVKL